MTTLPKDCSDGSTTSTARCTDTWPRCSAGESATRGRTSRASTGEPQISSCRGEPLRNCCDGGGCSDRCYYDPNNLPVLP